MSTHNIYFYGEVRKIITELSPNTPLTSPLLPHYYIGFLPYIIRILHFMFVMVISSVMAL